MSLNRSESAHKLHRPLGRKAEDAGLENDATRPLLVARLRAESNGVILPVLR
jgi:hypothetical protein